MSMRVLMIAPPGAGKGTQGALIAAHFDIPHIATGELLRDHVARRTAVGQAVQKYLDRGELVPDQIVLDMLREAIDRKSTRLNSSHLGISYAVFCLKKKQK